MITYLLHTTSVWIILFIAYKVLLSREKYFTLNRVYLLSSLVLGLLLPLLQFVNFATDQVLPEVSAVYHHQVNYISTLSNTITTSETETNSMDWISMFFILVTVGMAFMMLKTIVAGIQLNELYQHSEKLRHPEFTEVRTQKEHLPFSFFRYIFFSAFKLNEEDRIAILNHEIHHVRAKHTWDVLFVELIKVFFWWNPLVYLYKKAITENHEFAADHAAIARGSRKEYCALLLQSNMPGVNLNLGHPFFQTYIKKRIDMMYRKNSTRKSYLKFALPGMAIVMMAFVMQEDKLILDYHLDSEKIDLFVGNDLLIPDVDYTIDREAKKVIITNKKYINVKGLRTCMYAKYDTKKKMYMQDKFGSSSQDFILVSMDEAGTILMGNQKVNSETVFQRCLNAEQALQKEMFVKVAMDVNVPNIHFSEFSKLAFERNVLAFPVDNRINIQSKIPSICPIERKDILNANTKGSEFGMRIHPVHKEKKFHKGIDLIAKSGTPVYVTADGKVTRVESKSTGYGINVVVTHEDGYSTLYAHLQSANVLLDDKLQQGQQLGLVGTTGTSTRPHLHYEVRIDGKAVDPAKYGVNAENETHAELFGVVNDKREIWNATPMLGIPKDYYSEGSEIEVTYKGEMLIVDKDYKIDITRNELIVLLKSFDKSQVVVKSNTYNVSSSWRRKAREWEYSEGGNVIRMNTRVKDPVKIYVGLQEDGTELIQGKDYTYHQSNGYLTIHNQEVLNERLILDISVNKDYRNIFKETEASNLKALETNVDLFGKQGSLNKNGVIELGADVNEGIIVRVKDKVLKEGEDYILYRNSGKLRIVNSKYLQAGLPIQVEFLSDDSNFSFVYGAKVEVDKTVESDMVYDGDCKANKDGVYFMADNLPRLANCNTGNAEDDSSCTRSELTAYINENKKYPKALVKKGFQGMLIYNIKIDETGMVESYEELLRKKKGDDYPELMAEGNRLLELVKSNKKFVPAQCNGKNVKSMMNFSFLFELNEEQMKRVDVKDASNTNSTDQRVVFSGMYSGGGGFNYKSPMNVPYTVKVINPLGDIIFNKTYDFLYDYKVDGFDIENEINGRYQIEVTQDGQTVKNEITTSIYK